MKSLVVLLILLLALPALPALADDAPAKCKLVRLANWHVRLVGRSPIVEGYLDGKKIDVLIDTGAQVSLLTKKAAEKLGLQPRFTTQVLQGVGGGLTRVLLVRIDELRVGDFTAKGLRIRVAGEMPMPGIDFVLGQDFLHSVDIEFDYANGAVRLFQPLDCKDRPLSYWDPNAPTVPLSGNGKDVIPATVNGRKADAMIDSGASQSMVQLGFADRLGITPSSPGVQAAYCTSGLGAGMVHQWVATFDAVGIGGEVIRNAHLRFGELFSEVVYWRTSAPDMLLGGDFLKAHRVLIAHSQGKVYFTYAGGQAFPSTPGLDCGDERVAGKSAKEALAIYDEVLAKDPKDVKALLYRGTLRSAAQDWKGALSDLDATITAEPANAVAYGIRSRVRLALKDYDGALADSDAAAANGMQTADMFFYRAYVRRAAGDHAGTMAELDAALTLDPHHLGALRDRGRFRYLDGNYAGAEEDFRTALAVRPDAFDSIWLYFIRVRRGDGKPEPLEAGIAQLKNEEWPLPLMQYLLDRIDRAALMKAAATDEKERKGRECEARFYDAERFLIAGKKDEARPLLESAVADCPTGYIEYGAALTELDRIK